MKERVKFLKSLNWRKWEIGIRQILMIWQFVFRDARFHPKSEILHRGVAY